MKSLFSIFMAICLMLAAVSLQAVEVVATGSAPGDAPEARAQALSDALREAVRTGAGIDLVSETQTKDFALEFDRTFSKSRGYVRKYEVVSSGLREDGIYTVTIKAEVGELAAGAGDKLTFQMLVREHQAPRVSVQLTENIAGVADSRVAADWLGNTATECGLKVVDVSRSQGGMGARAEALGRTQEAALRTHGAVSACDYIIEGEITGSLTGEQSFYGSKPAKRFSLGANLRVIDAATGLVLLAEIVPSRDILVRQVSSDSAAVREAVRQLLEGNPRVADSDSGWKLIRRIFSCWSAETDLGATIRMEFTGMDAAKAATLKEKLAEQKGVGAMWIRSVDAAGISVIDCESRLDSTTLAQVVCTVLPGYTLDRSERRLLSFLVKGGSPASTSLQLPSQETEEDADVKFYVCAGGTILVLAVAFFFLKPKNNMKTLKSIIMSVVCAASMVSCSQKSIEMTRLYPGSMDIPQDTCLNVYMTGSNLDKRLAQAFEQEWQRRRELTPGNGTGPRLFVQFNNTSVTRYQSGYADLRTTASFTLNGTYKRKIYDDGAWQDPYAGMAREIVTELLPGTATYTVYVKTDKEKNPKLLEAVMAVKSGNWNQGAQLAQESLSLVPDDPETWYLLGMIARKNSDYAKSNDCFRKAYSIKADNKYMNALNANSSISQSEAQAKRQLGL